MRTKRLLLLATSILAITTLGACRRGSGNKSTSGADQSTTGGHIIPSTGAGTSTTSSSSTHTAKSVIIDICKILFEEDDPKSDQESSTDYSYWDNKDGSYGTGVSYGSYDESYLEAAIESLAEELPTYLTALNEPEAGTWSDGTNGYFQDFGVDDVIVSLGSYVESSTLGCQIDVYPESMLED